jgi:AmmeMemoRadiSam system protein B
VEDSQRALREFSSRLIGAGPETVVVISPHSPLDPRSFTARRTARLSGDFGDFYAPQVSLAFDNDIDLLDAIEQAAMDEGVSFRKLDRDYPLDHGALVPLYYLHEAGWRGPIIVICFTNRPNEDHVAFGRSIGRGAARINRRVAILASGDLSHRLIVGGPYEFEPTAHLFDEQIVEATARGDARAVIEIDQGLRERAGECGYRSIVTALGSVDCAPTSPQVLSYEGPFGVGYMVAVLADRNQN